MAPTTASTAATPAHIDGLWSVRFISAASSAIERLRIDEFIIGRRARKFRAVRHTPSRFRPGRARTRIDDDVLSGFWVENDHPQYALPRVTGERHEHSSTLLRQKLQRLLAAGLENEKPLRFITGAVRVSTGGKTSTFSAEDLQLH